MYHRPGNRCALRDGPSEIADGTMFAVMQKSGIEVDKVKGDLKMAW